MRVSIVVDDREPAGLVEALRAHPDVREVTVDRLAVGDIVIGDVAFERKTLRDYVSGVAGRAGVDVADQLARLSAEYDRAYLLLEADLADAETLRTAVSPASVYGSIAAIVARHGVPVIPCSDQRRLVELAVRIGRKAVEAPSAKSLPVGSVPSRSEPTAKRMYGCIDGIGPQLAATLYEAYPTVESLVSASPDEIRRLDGVGETRARAVYEAFHGDERASSIDPSDGAA
ncbi:ERCC4 domain-containing protein [Haloferacaceae archaeon DSL9]